MRSIPTVPDISSAPEGFFDSGHFWIQELVDGVRLRFEMKPSGLLRFGDRDGIIDTEDPPPHLQAAVTRVRERFDRDALRNAVDDVDRYTFVGTAPVGGQMGYQWETVPAVLGTDILDAVEDELLAPDATHRIYDELGLDPVHVFEREVPARRISSDSYTIPESHYADEPAAGVRLRKKGGPTVKGSRTLDADGATTDGPLEDRIDDRLSTEFLRDALRQSGRDPAGMSPAEVAEPVTRRLAQVEFHTFEDVLTDQPARFRKAVADVLTDRWSERFERG
ncbi:MAG: hypothetical protein ABEJ27_03990 [Halodesulfurarchaeum sp.]